MPNTRKSIFSIPWWWAAEEDFAWIPKSQWWLRIQARFSLRYTLFRACDQYEKRFWFIKKLKHVPLIASPSQMFLMVSRDNQSSAKTSKGKIISGRSTGRIQEIEYHHKFGWYQWKANEVFGWRFLSSKNFFTEATTQHSRTDARFFSLTEALM